MIDPADCATCGGSRLMMGGWMGPTPQRPYPDACPRCSDDISARERQVIQTQWLLDHADEPRVKEVLAQLAVVNRQRYRVVLHVPLIRTIDREDLRGVRDIYEQIRDADLIVGAGNMVLKDKFGPAQYVLSDSEFRRVREDCVDFRRL